MQQKHLFTRIINFALALAAPAALALGLTLTTLWLSRVRAASYTVCPDGPPTCDYATIQAAVDAASDGDIVKVATGTYTGVSARPVPSGYAGDDDLTTITQTVYISKSVTIRGGYTSAFADPPDPDANPSTLDAQGQGRVLVIAGNVNSTIEGLRITGGDAAGLGGHPYSHCTGTEDGGGGVYAIDTSFSFGNNHVFSNTAIFGGGMYYLRSSGAALAGNVISSNTAGIMYRGGGGGLYLNDSDAVLDGNVINGNTADGAITGGGGGLYLDGSNASLNNNVVSHNTAVKGGAGVALSYSDASLDGNVFSYNSAYSGGGVSLSHSDANLSDNTITFNTATRFFGGGLLVLYSDVTLDGNTITWNTANHGGGGAYVAYSDGTWTNNLIAHNQVDSVGVGSVFGGSGIYIYNGQILRLLHTTLVRNTGGDGSGIFITHDSDDVSAVSLSNTILVDHTLGITVARDAQVTLEATLWGAGEWANGTDWGGAGDIVTGTINVWGDPGFVGADDYHIGLTSAAIDRGVDAGVVDDMDGEPRPQGSGYDIGADEVGLWVASQAAPNPVQPGEQLTFTIRVTNTGDAALHATITDTLPLHVTLDGTSGWTLTLPGGATAITWTVTISPAGVWVGTVIATLDQGYKEMLTNQVEVTTQEGLTGSASVIVNLRRIYLPLVARQ